MSSQITFFEKNRGDRTNPNVTANASEGFDSAAFALSNTRLNAWVTSGSVDANNTTWSVDYADKRDLSEIILVKHNFRSFKVQWWDGAAYQDFTPAINETSNTSSVNRYSVSQVSTSNVRVTVYGTQTANSEKFLYQFIASSLIGRLNGWPIISNLVYSKNKRDLQVLSGKHVIAQNVGAVSFNLSVKEWKDPADLTIMETLAGSSEGFLVWLCGGDEAQFSSKRLGYRLEDFFLMKVQNEYSPDFAEGGYTRGLKISFDFVEVVR